MTEEIEKKPCSHCGSITYQRGYQCCGCDSTQLCEDCFRNAEARCPICTQAKLDNSIPSPNCPVGEKMGPGIYFYADTRHVEIDVPEMLRHFHLPNISPVRQMVLGCVRQAISISNRSRDGKPLLVMRHTPEPQAQTPAAEETCPGWGR